MLISRMVIPYRFLIFFTTRTNLGGRFSPFSPQISSKGACHAQRSMAASKPVVATDVGGVRDLLGEIREKGTNGVQLAGNGILIPSEDAEALASALLFLLENREKIDQMTVNAKNFVSRKYSLKRLIDDIETLYAELVNDGAA